MKADVLIIGAGPAGLFTAARLAERGFAPLIVEQGLFPGGQASRLACKAAPTCARCNACLLETALTELAETKLSRLMSLTTVTAAEQTSDGWRVGLRTEPLLLDPDVCVDCGACLDQCPAASRAIRRAPAAGFGPRYGLDPSGCLRFAGQDCRACADVCPVGAIDFEAQAREETVQVRAVTAAVGFTPFDARLKPRFGYGRVPGVVTAMDLEEMLRQDASWPTPDGRPPEKAAFIQCVGSRDRKLGRDYCSRICCAYALRLARLLRRRRRDSTATFFYMDIQTVGRNFDRYLQKTAQTVELVHGVPGEITSSEDGRPGVPFLNEATGRTERRDFDLVVLSIGLGGPAADLDEIFGFQRNQDGFLLENGRPGLFVTGAALGPASVAESKARAEACAARAAAWLAGRQ